MLGEHIDRRTIYNYFTPVTNHKKCDALKVKHYHTTRDVEIASAFFVCVACTGFFFFFQRCCTPKILKSCSEELCTKQFPSV